MKRLCSYDLIRIIAIFAVIIIHVSAEFWYGEINNTWLAVNFINSFVHAWAVPLFITLSGALMLRDKEKEIPLNKILKVYLPKMIFVLIIWHYIYDIYTYKAINFEILINSTKNLLNGNSYSHLWYLYLTIGLYFLTPLLNKLVNSLTKKELEFYLIIGFIISLGIPFINSILSLNIGVIFDKMYVVKFHSYLLYYILGFYLRNITIKKAKLLYLFSIFSLGLLILCCLLSNYISIDKNIQFTLSIETNISGLFIVISIFLLAKEKIKFESNFINTMGKITFGTYLIHFIVEKTILEFIPKTINTTLHILLISILVFIISYIISYVISKTPVLKKIINL